MSLPILVTGCCGFIGWKVTELLLASGREVVGIDNMNDAYDVRLKNWRFARLDGKPGFTFHKTDICDRDALRQIFQRRFDAVVNLAARAGVRQSVENPWMYYETNVNGTLNLLEACKDFGVKKFVLASTSSLYGANNPLPFREDADTSHPLSPYAASKKAAEVLCHTYHYLHGIDVTVLRYFTVYGPAGRPDMSLFRFVQGVIENRLITIYGDGKQLRDFTYVGDIARGTLAGLNRMGYEVINLGSDCPVNLMDVIELVENLVGCKAWTQFASRHASDVPATWADVRKAHGFLGWQPRTTFEDGVRDLVNWCRSNREWIKDIRTE